MRATASGLLLLVVLAGCARFGSGDGGTSSPVPSAGPPDVAGAWVLRHGDGPAGEIVVPDDFRVTLTFTGNEVGGQACNHYGGTYELEDDGSIRLGAMGMTEMACAEPMMTTEMAYHAALGAVRSVARSGDTLTLSGEDTQLVFELLPPVPDAALRGTRWELESLILGEAVSSVQGEAWLRLAEDGTLSGSSGCRALTGSYVVSGDQLVPTDLRAEGECPARLEAQDRHVIEVLEGFSATVDGDQLTLMLPNGHGLGLRRADR